MSVYLHSIGDFLDDSVVIPDSPPSYYYQGYCPQTRKLLKLPRTALIEAIARGLMQVLAQDSIYNQEGKMYGVLLVETTTGQLGVIKAFSGLLQGQSVVLGWIPPIPGREQVSLQEARTLASLESIKQELLNLRDIPEREQYQILAQEWQIRLEALNLDINQRKLLRKEQREYFCQNMEGEALNLALEALEQQSRDDGIRKKLLKRERDRILQPLRDLIQATDKRISELKQQRKALSRQLQTEMQNAYYLTNFAGQSLTINNLADSIPTGMGDCCAPKLLHYAATHHLKPVAMAEFWWGCTTSENRVQGAFYPACKERCEPLMGFLLSGQKYSDQLSVISNQFNPPQPPLKREEYAIPKDEKQKFCDKLLIYEDEWLIIVNKPSGILSVPGRYSDRQDSILSRLRYTLPDGSNLIPVHRLDLETSGLLMIARNLDTYRQLSHQFQQRQVTKIYEAILEGIVTEDEGIISLPLWGDPRDRPYQKVNWQQGKPSITHFKVINRENKLTRIEFKPLTGRTHQLRVHAADKQGLGIAIVGDSLYGLNEMGQRLHLHARELTFKHPDTNKYLNLCVNNPF